MSGISIESISSEHALTLGKKDVDARNTCGHDGVLVLSLIVPLI